MQAASKDWWCATHNLVLTADFILCCLKNSLQKGTTACTHL